jgi:acetyl esterase/lipase
VRGERQEGAGIARAEHEHVGIPVFVVPQGVDGFVLRRRDVDQPTEQRVDAQDRKSREDDDKHKGFDRAAQGEMISGRMVEHAHKEDCWEAFALPTVDPKVTAFNEMTAKALLQVAPLYTMSLHQAREQRAQWARRAATGYGGYRTLIPDAPGLRARELRAEPARGLYLHIHGGGWVLGGPDQQDELLGELRDRAGVSVLSVAYRLAPEHPFPAAVEDVEAALRWALEQGLEELGASALVLGGESAGANLAVAALDALAPAP